MTPEQMAKAKEMADVLEANAEENLAQMPPEVVEQHKKQLEEASAGNDEVLRELFLTGVADHPLLVLALTQFLGGRVMHVIDEHPELEGEEKFRHLANDVMGSLEILVHGAIKAVRENSAA